MKRKKKMAVLLCTLLILSGVYFIVQRSGKKEDVSKSAGTFALTEKTAADLRQISWQKDEAAYAFTNKDGVWSSDNEPECPVEQKVVNELANNLLKLQASGKLENITELADYGLKKPAFSVTAAWSDGSSTIYCMGDATPFADGYYVMLSGNDKTVYTVPSSLKVMFNKTQKDLIQMENIPAVQNAVQLSIGNKLNAVKKNESLTVDPNQHWYDASADIPLDDSEIKILLTQAAGIQWKELVMTKASGKELSDWKLDEENAVKISVSASDGPARIILIGSQNESGGYYARLPESTMVYIVDKDPLSSLLAASVDTLWNKAVLPISYENLAKAEFVTERGSYSFETTPENKITENSETAPAETLTPVDSAEAEKDGPNEELKKLWDHVTALKATERLETAMDGKQVLSIHAVSKKGRETTVVITDYSVDSYQAVVDGGSPKLVPAEKIDLLVRTVRTIQ